MLVISRKIGETLVIDGRITITVVGMRGRQIRIGIVAPADVRVLRGELEPFAHTPAATNANATVANAGDATAIAAAFATPAAATATNDMEAEELDPTRFATADGMVCESFADCYGLGEHRNRLDAESTDEVTTTTLEAVMPTAKPARPRRALGLRGFRETRRSRTLAGTSSIGSANAAATRAATEQPAAASDAGHTVRATAG